MFNEKAISHLQVNCAWHVQSLLLFTEISVIATYKYNIIPCSFMAILVYMLAPD